MEALSTEFEIKAALQSVDVANDLLRVLKFSHDSSSTDIYYDTVCRDLFIRGVFLRLRDSSVFEIKYNPDTADVSHVSCEERKYAWPIGYEQQLAIANFLRGHITLRQTTPELDPFQMFGLQEFVKIEKHRAVYLGDDIEVSIDRIDNLGSFLEVEAKSPNGRNRVLEFCTSHGLANLPLGYVELWLRKNEYPTYLKGRYVLEEDKPNQNPLTDAAGK